MRRPTLKCEVDDSVDTFAIGSRAFRQLDLPSISYLQTYRVEIKGLAWHGKLGEVGVGFQRGNVLLVSISLADLLDLSRRSMATISVSQADQVNRLLYEVIKENPSAIPIMEGLEVQPGDVYSLDGEPIKIIEGAGYITSETRLENAEPSKGLSKSKVQKIGHSKSDHDAIGFGRLAGKEGVIREFQNKVLLPFNNPDLATKHLGSPINGVLIYGPDGVGKTTVIKAIADEANASLFRIPVTASTDVASIRSTYKKACSKKGKCIISVDPINGFMCDEERGNIGVRVLQECLDNSQESKHVITIAAANKPTDLPQSLLRAGRLEQAIEVGLPGRTQRQELFKYFLRKVTPKAAIDYQLLADLTESYTGADIQRVIRETALRAMVETKTSGEGEVTTENILNIINARGFP